jgi:hypothetical protein
MFPESFLILLLSTSKKMCYLARTKKTILTTLFYMFSIFICIRTPKKNSRGQLTRMDMEDHWLELLGPLTEGLPIEVF